MAQTVRNLPAIQETQVQSLGQEDPLEKDLYAAVGTVKVPGQTVTDIIIEKEGLILREYTDGIDTRVDAV